MLAADLRFPKPKLLRREFIELIGNEEEGGKGGRGGDGSRRIKRGRRSKGQDSPRLGLTGLGWAAVRWAGLGLG